MTRDYTYYMTHAGNALTKGFTSQKAQKDANDFAGRAYEKVRREVMDVLLEADDKTRETETWRDRYNSLPFSLAHVRPKHYALFPDMAEPMQRIQAAVALREKIKAASVVKCEPVRTAKQREADEKARTCQICARPIFAETGVIAHHGYERPGYGYQTSSCWGARYLPFETDRSILLNYIAQQRKDLEAREIRRAAVEAETLPVDLSYEVRRMKDGAPVIAYGRHVYDVVRFEVTRETMEAMRVAHARYFGKVYGDVTFDAIKTVDLANRDYEIIKQRAEIEMQQSRADAWVKLEEWKDGKWVKV